MRIKSRRSLRTEPLEPRMLLAGDVLNLTESFPRVSGSGDPPTTGCPQRDAHNVIAANQK